MYELINSSLILDDECFRTRDQDTSRIKRDGKREKEKLGYGEMRYSNVIVSFE